MSKYCDVTVYAKTYLTTVVRVPLEDGETEEDAAKKGVAIVRNDIAAHDWAEPLCGIDDEGIDESLTEVEEVEATDKDAPTLEEVRDRLSNIPAEKFNGEDDVG